MKRTIQPVSISFESLSGFAEVLQLFEHIRVNLFDQFIKCCVTMDIVALSQLLKHEFLQRDGVNWVLPGQLGNKEELILICDVISEKGPYCGRNGVFLN